MQFKLIVPDPTSDLSVSRASGLTGDPYIKSLGVLHNNFWAPQIRYCFVLVQGVMLVQCLALLPVSKETMGLKPIREMSGWSL